jgi:hypothetical protein
MKAGQLIVGRAYFMCGYYFRDRPIPAIETWIYVGTESDEEGICHRFQDPATYYPDEYVKQIPDGENGELPEVDIVLVRDQDIEMVYDISELEEFVAGLRSEPNAKDVF